MTMTANGLAKLAEECGELLQVIGKRLAYYDTDQHPDKGPPLSRRLVDEMADVTAVIQFVLDAHELDKSRFEGRVRGKLMRLREWHLDSGNNAHGVAACVAEAAQPEAMSLRASMEAAREQAAASPSWMKVIHERNEELDRRRRERR